MNLAILAEQNLEQFGEYERLVFEDQSFSNADLHAQSSRLAGALVELGLAPGDKVVVIMPNSPAVLVAYPAIWRAGLTVIPVLFLLEERELVYILKNSQARAVITSPDQQSKVLAAAAQVQSVAHVIVTGAGSGGEQHLSFEELAAQGKQLANAVARSKDDLAVLLYTSGTTGLPKGVMQTHHNLRSATLNAQNSGRKSRPDDVGLLVLPLAHSFGLSVLVGGYIYGGKAVLMRWFEPEQALALIQKHRVRAMAGVPAMFIGMLAHPAAEKYDTSSMERWLVGAAPMPTKQLERFEERFGGTMYVGYGLTEACPGIATEREGMPRKPGSTGVPMAGVDVKIIDDQGAELPRGEVGELIARGENISPGYLGREEETARTFRDGWLHTGDMAYQDEEDYVFIVERKKDLIIRGGFNVYPKDVEEVIHQLPDVTECAVVGVPHERLGEEVAAYVVIKKDSYLDAERLIAYCQEHLAKYKTPRHVVFLGALPKNRIGKIMKKELRKRAAEELA